jgi:hypothetical protein
MEVCGRYHHWMPILVRVVHKDIFLSWCLAYVRLLLPREYEQGMGVGSVLDKAVSTKLTRLFMSLSVIV